MEDEITEKDDRIAQLEQQVIYNTSLLAGITVVFLQECPKPQVTTVSARRRPLVQKLVRIGLCHEYTIYNLPIIF